MIYDLLKIESEIRVIAEQNDGEISEEDLQALVEAHSKTVQGVEGICKLVRHLELYMSACDLETSRIKIQKNKAEKRYESVKKFLAPFVKNRGKFDAGTFKLSTRESTSVLIDETIFKHKDNKHLYRRKVENVPNKQKIRESLEKGVHIAGCKLIKKDNLVIK